jgi:D-alanyl-D-alanine carboxypeptidase
MDRSKGRPAERSGQPHQNHDHHHQPLAVLTLPYGQRYSSLHTDILIRVSQTSASHSGTTADLKVGKYIKIYDLFYGAMLPSGNDAAYLLA